MSITNRGQQINKAVQHLQSQISCVQSVINNSVLDTQHFSDLNTSVVNTRSLILDGTDVSEKITKLWDRISVLEAEPEVEEDLNEGLDQLSVSISGSDDPIILHGSWMATKSDATYPYTYFLLSGTDEGTWQVSGNIATKNGESYIFSNGVYNNDKTVLLGFNLRKDIDTLFAIKSGAGYSNIVIDGNMSFTFELVSHEDGTEQLNLVLAIMDTIHTDYSSSIGWFGSTIGLVYFTRNVFIDTKIVNFSMYWLSRMFTGANDIFQSCVSLKTVDFSNLTSIESNAYPISLLFDGSPLNGASRYNYKILSTDGTNALTEVPSTGTIITHIISSYGSVYAFAPGQSTKVVSVEGYVVTLSGT